MTGALSGGRTPRRAAVVVAACVLGLLPGSGSAARDAPDPTTNAWHTTNTSGKTEAQEQRQVRLTAAYDCALPSGRRHITVVVDAAFPRRGAVGKPIQPTAVRIRASVPRPVVAELLPEATASVTGAAALATTVAQGRQRARAPWTGLQAADAKVTAQGAVEIGFRGDVPYVTVGSEGDVTFTAGKLDLALTATPADSDPDENADADAHSGTGTGATAPATGAPDVRPASTRLACTPARGTDTLLAAVPVEAPASGAPTAPATGSAGPDSDAPRGTPQGIDTGPRPRAALAPCPAQPPKGTLDPKRLPPVPPGGEVTELEATSMCAVPAGFATLRKLKSSALVNDPRGRSIGLMHLAMRMREVRAPDYVEYDHLGIMQLPDAEGTFLTFGFQPTTAKVRFEPEPATIVNIIRPGRPPVTQVGYRQHLRLYDVRVNGVPLDVGPRCRTSRPVETELTGSYPVSEGGLLQGELSIPPLRGCGANGEDLDVLLSGAVSGPGNALKIRQGRVCGAGSTCKIPELPGF
ncbi:MULTISPECIES: DUF6801 domain-containing protein [Streptomyces]